MKEGFGSKYQKEIDVVIQDNTTLSINGLFSQSISNFTLAANTIASTVDTLYYTFTATTGHGLVIGNEIILLETSLTRSLHAVVLNVATDVITIDRPIDLIYSTATTLGRKITTNMAVDGSTTPQIFSFRAGVIPQDFTTMFITASGSNPMDFSKFMGAAGLTRGLVFRILNGHHQTIHCFKTDRNFDQFGHVTYSDKAPAGKYGIVIEFTFKEHNGTIYRLGENDVLQLVVQDNLLTAATGLDSITASLMGSETTGEQ